MTDTILKPVSGLAPGDELAQDIMAGAHLLLRRGTVLTDAQIERLRRLNLEVVKIAQAAEPVIVSPPPVPSAAGPAVAVKLPSFTSLASDDAPGWISDGQFSLPVPLQVQSVSERAFSERKTFLRQQAGLVPLLDPAKDEELTRKLEAAYIQSAVQKKVFLDRLEALAGDLSAALNSGGEYLDLSTKPQYLSFNDIARHGQHLIASCMQAAKMYRLLVQELPEELYQTQLKAHLALSNVFVLLPSHYYTHSMTAQGDAPLLAEAVGRYAEWLAGQQFIPQDVLAAAEKRLLCQHHPDPTQARACSSLPPETQRLAVAGFYCERLYSLPNRPRLAPHDAAQQVVQQAERLFASKEVNLFLQRIGYFPLGSLVELSTGALALVVRQNRNALLKPVIQLLDSSGELNGEQDLTQTREVYIRRQVLEY
jgi:hypothetical protein